jgi:hypothetical protein
MTHDPVIAYYVTKHENGKVYKDKDKCYVYFGAMAGNTYAYCISIYYSASDRPDNRRGAVENRIALNNPYKVGGTSSKIISFERKTPLK